MMQVVGMRKVDFPDRAKGIQVVGTTLYVVGDFPSNSAGIGRMAEKVFVKDGIDLSGISVGDEIRFIYNKYGKVDGVEVL